MANLFATGEMFYMAMLCCRKTFQFCKEET
uniref:Uncharacterized protein n=1 Tax=Rhizophora mucronata TaxID=61149 RepID=A0A2P2Q0V9_RHIMU